MISEAIPTFQRPQPAGAHHRLPPDSFLQGGRLWRPGRRLRADPGQPGL